MGALFFLILPLRQVITNHLMSYSLYKLMWKQHKLHPKIHYIIYAPPKKPDIINSIRIRTFLKMFPITKFQNLKLKTLLSFVHFFNMEGKLFALLSRLRKTTLMIRYIELVYI